MSSPEKAFLKAKGRRFQGWSIHNVVGQLRDRMKVGTSGLELGYVFEGLDQLTFNVAADDHFLCKLVIAVCDARNDARCGR